MILAAGLGTRSHPLTDHKPKALVEIAGVPLLEAVITKLIKQGINTFTLNVHHFPEQILEFLHQKENFGVKISISDETDALLDSGGGILKASQYFLAEEAILVHNVDVISNISIREMFQYHQNRNAQATLAVRNRNTKRYYLFDPEYKLCGWKNLITAEELRNTGEDTPVNPLAFSGISILSAEFIQNISHQGCFPVRDEFLKQSATGNIMGYQNDTDYWMDVGKPEQLAQAEHFLRSSASF